MAQHSIKIGDRLYTKLKVYCDLNNEKIFTISEAAIEDYLNKIQFGDAPFLKYEHENPQNSPNMPLEIEKNTEEKEATSAKTPSVERIEVRAVPLKDADEMITELLSNNTFEDVKNGKVNDTMNKETPRRQGKRRL